MDTGFKRIKLEEKIPPKSRRGGRKFLRRRAKWIWAATVAVLMTLFIWSAFGGSTSVFRYVLPIGGPTIKQTDGRVNVLLLGIGGGNHDGADLTDSIIVASYELKTGNVTLFSIPRDVWLPNINEKINAAYEIGKAQGHSDEAGLTFAGDKIDDILGIPIHYEVLMDFSGFSKAIDLVGGVDVNVPNTFDDYKYPITGKENDLCGWKQEQVTLTDDQAKQLNLPKGPAQIYVDPTGKIASDSASLDFSCRFMHVHFDKGLTHMNGDTALEFVRSRHAYGVEGSDFARSKRQQLVIQAFRDKAFSLQTLSNPQKILGLVNDFGDSFKTDIPTGQFPDFYTLAKNVKRTDSVVLGDLGNGQSLFINPPISDKYGGAWVLVPPNDDFLTVAKFVHDTLNPLPTPSPSSPPKKAKNP